MSKTAPQRRVLRDPVRGSGQTKPVLAAPKPAPAKARAGGKADAAGDGKADGKATAARRSDREG